MTPKSIQGYGYRSAGYMLILFSSGVITHSRGVSHRPWWRKEARGASL